MRGFCPDEPTANSNSLQLKLHWIHITSAESNLTARVPSFPSFHPWDPGLAHIVPVGEEDVGPTSTQSTRLERDKAAKLKVSPECLSCLPATKSRNYKFQTRPRQGLLYAVEYWLALKQSNILTHAKHKPWNQPTEWDRLQKRNSAWLIFIWGTLSCQGLREGRVKESYRRRKREVRVSILWWGAGPQQWLHTMHVCDFAELYVCKVVKMGILSTLVPFYTTS